MWLVLFNLKTAPLLFFGGALWVLSVNRLYLATASAVVPRLVPHEDLLMANSMATVGGTVALLFGVFVGGWIADLVEDNTLVIAIAGGEWLVASLVATRIRSPLLPHHVPEAPVGDQLGASPGSSPTGSRGWRERREPSGRSRRSRSTRWDRASCSCSRCSCSATGSRRAWGRSRT